MPGSYIRLLRRLYLQILPFVSTTVHRVILETTLWLESESENRSSIITSCLLSFFFCGFMFIRWMAVLHFLFSSFYSFFTGDGLLSSFFCGSLGGYLSNTKTKVAYKPLQQRKTLWGFYCSLLFLPTMTVVLWLNGFVHLKMHTSLLNQVANKIFWSCVWRTLNCGVSFLISD